MDFASSARASEDKIRRNVLLRGGVICGAQTTSQAYGIDYTSVTI